MGLLRRFSFTLLLMSLMTLVACGGGDGGLSREDGGGDGTTGDIITVTLAITDQSISEQRPAIITATVTQEGVALSGKLVTFSLDITELAFFTPNIGTASTDSDGKATIQLNAGGTAGAGIVTVSVDSADPVTITFISAGDGNTVGVSTVASIGIFANTQQLVSSGADEVTLTAIAKDDNNNLLEGITVSFQADSGNIELVNTITGTDGKASAKLTTENEPLNRIINVIASSDLIKDTVSVQVVGTSVTLTGSSSLAIDDDNTYIIKVVDSDGNGLGNKVVNLSLSGLSSEPPAGSVANVTIPVTVTTNFDGQASFVAQGTTGGTNSIIADVLGANVSQSISVQADSFLFTQFSDGNGTTVDPSVAAIPDVLLSNTANVELTWFSSLSPNTPVADGTVVNFTTTRGLLSASSATTFSGKVSTTLTSTNAGKSLITFEGIDGGIALKNELEFEFVADTVETIKAQASPKSLSPNGDTSTISVVVKDINGNLVKGKSIDFTLEDTNGGDIFPASAVTDSSGNASTVYTSGSTSAQDGISITATVNEDISKADTVTLTVADRELFIVLGTGNSLEQFDFTSYNKKYSVWVTDADSNPVDNVTVTISAVPKGFYKGQWVKVFDAGEFKTWAASYSSVLCLNEDVNLDGIKDSGEDTNNDGVLTPGNVVTVTGEVITDELGHGIIDIIYAESFAQWVDINLVASAKVSGTESEKAVTFTLPVLASDVNIEDIVPPTASVGLNSPFGASNVCDTVE
jgi:hypothetical protein